MAKRYFIFLTRNANTYMLFYLAKSIASPLTSIVTVFEIYFSISKNRSHINQYFSRVHLNGLPCHAMQCHSIQCHAMQDFLFCQVALIGSCADLMSFTNSSQVGIRMMLFLCYVGWRFSIQISLNRGAQSKIFTMQLAYSLLGKTFVTTVRDQ